MLKNLTFVADKFALLDFGFSNAVFSHRRRFYHNVVGSDSPCFKVVASDIFHEIVNVKDDFLFNRKKNIVDIGIVYNHVFQIRRNIMRS